MDRSLLIERLTNDYAEKRRKSHEEALARYEAAVSKDPEIAVLRLSAYNIASGALRQSIDARDLSGIKAAAEKMKNDGIKNTLEIKRRLVKLGLPEDYLDEKHDCPICEDKGILPGTFPAKFCRCFEKALREAMFEDGTMSDLKEQNFDRFDEKLLYKVNEKNDADFLMNVKAYCERYADSYPNNPKTNLLLMGESGTGKTFLMNCIYERVISRGFSAVRITAYRLFEAMRKRHMGSYDNDSGFDELIDAPLLIIDDLGTEPMLKNITIEYLFTIMNERNNMNRHTLIATNLNHQYLMERYGERVVSRMFDSSKTNYITLKGVDLRKAH